MISYRLTDERAEEIRKTADEKSERARWNWCLGPSMLSPGDLAKLELITRIVRGKRSGGRRRRGAGPNRARPEPTITLDPWEARLLWDVYHGDPNDRVRDPIQARAILDRARGEADAYFDAMMWWDTKRRRAGKRSTGDS